MLTWGHSKGNYEVKKKYLIFQDTASVCNEKIYWMRFCILYFILYLIFIYTISTRNINPFPTESNARVYHVEFSHK